MPLFPVLLLLACTGKDTGETGETDTDTDTDADTDTDSDTDTDTDTGTDTGTGDPADIPWLDAGTPTIAPPVIDWLESGRPPVSPPSRVCPEGWTEEPLADGGHQCDPWPAGAREECTDANEMHLPGTAGCAPVGGDCPTGDWPEDAGDANTWYVAVGGAGAGTRDDPFGSVADAVAVAAAGDTVVVGEGTFDGTVNVAADLTIRGLCPARTTLTRSSVRNEESGVVNVTGGTVTVQDLRIADTAAVGLVASNATLSLSGVVIDGVTNHGISATTTALTLTDVLVENISPRASDNANGDAIYVYGGSLVAERIGMSGAWRVGLWSEGSTIDVSDVVAFDIASEASTGQRGGAVRHYSDLDGVVRRIATDHTQSYSIVLTTGAGDLAVEDAWMTDITAQTVGDAFGAIGTAGTGTFTLSGAVIQNVEAYGVVSQSDSAPVGPTIIEDVVIRGVIRTAYRIPDYYGNGAGLKAYNSPDLSASRVVIEDTEGDGVNLGFSDYITPTSASLSDLVARRNGRWLGYLDSSSGGAGVTTYAADVTLDRAIIEDETRAGVAMDYGAGSLVATDVYIGGGDVDGVTEPGMGVATGASSGGDLSFTRLVVDNAHTYGLDILDAASATFEDLVVRGTRSHPQLGRGFPARLSSWESAPVAVHRAALTGGAGAGIGMQLVTADLQDVSISGIDSLDADGRGGFGIAAKYADVTLARAALTDVRYGGIWANAGSLALTDVLVSGVSSQACAADTCPDDDAATALFIGADPGNDVTATLDQVVLEGADGVGLQLGAGATTATDVMVRTNGVGADTASGTLTAERVSYDGNTVASAASTQPTLPWGVVVANPNAAGVDLGMPLVAGTYLPLNVRNGEDTCTTLFVFYYPVSSGLDWQGTSEFTFAGGGGDPPSACVWDGTNVTCGGTFGTYALDEETVLTISVAQSDFQVRSGTSFTMVETATYTCEGTSCDGYPCSWSMSEAWSQ